MKKNSSTDSDQNEYFLFDLSFSHLFDCISADGFTNRFRSAEDYIRFSATVSQMLFQELSACSRKTFHSSFVQKQRHVHIVDEKHREILHQIVVTSLKNDPKNAERASQIIEGSEIWSVGFTGSGRMFGVIYGSRTFMPILFDPNHMVYRSRNGQARKRHDSAACKFSPYALRDQKQKTCLRCGSDQKLIRYREDFALGHTMYICEKCYLELIENTEE